MGRLVAPQHLTDHQPDEILDFQHRVEDLGEQLTEPLAHRVAVEGGDRRRREVINHPVFAQHRHEQIPFRGEVVVERRHVQAGSGGQVAHARPVHPVLGHEGEGNFEDVLTLAFARGSAGLLFGGWDLGHGAIVGETHRFRRMQMVMTRDFVPRVTEKRWLAPSSLTLGDRGSRPDRPTCSLAPERTFG